MTLSCPDKPGIVADVSSFLAHSGCNITSSNQFGDIESKRFFMRVAFAPNGGKLEKTDLDAAFKMLAARYDMQWAIHDTSKKQKVLILVSKFDHCLMDLLYREKRGALDMDIAGVISNHTEAAHLCKIYDTPFHHWPVTKDNKQAMEEQLFRFVDDEAIDLVILARYMQILSDKACTRLSGKVINIHHSFLPSFKGAAPYSQAFKKGVKLIGATAHYVTADLDEGPIIEQNVARVNHAMTATDLVSMGRDVERITLSEAVKMHLERRILLNGNKTVVFKTH